MGEEYCKSACQECNGRISLPVDAVGVDFNCPHCGVNLQLVLKHYCEHCNGPLSFDGNPDAIGMEIECGHCQNQTVLQPSALVIEDENSSAPEEEYEEEYDEAEEEEYEEEYDEGYEDEADEPEDLEPDLVRPNGVAHPSLDNPRKCASARVEVGRRLGTGRKRLADGWPARVPSPPGRNPRVAVGPVGPSLADAGVAAPSPSAAPGRQRMIRPRQHPVRS